MVNQVEWQNLASVGVVLLFVVRFVVRLLLGLFVSLLTCLPVHLLDFLNLKSNFLHTVEC